MTTMSVTQNDLLAAAIAGARALAPDADDDRIADIAARILTKLPARISMGVVEARSAYRGDPDDWRTISYVRPEQVPALNAGAGWERYRVVSVIEVGPS